MFRPLSRSLLGCTVLVAISCLARPVLACPFCSAVSQTFSEEIGTMDAVVIARLVEPPPPPSKSAVGEEVAKAKFKVSEVIKGATLLEGQAVIETIYFGDAKKGTSFLVMGVDPPNVMWSTPLALTERAAAYIRQITKLPEEGAARLNFFQQYLEDEDEMLARDAYDEFAKAPYQAVKDLKSKMDHQQLVDWIQDPDIPASRRRLYLTMLGVCGDPQDLPMLEQLLRSKDRKQKAGLDAMIACYLTLKGAAGMPLIEELFLKDEKAEYADTYAAIMALRFHGTEGDIVPRKRILQGLHYMLERPQLADLVIPDLARWEDWSKMERLVQLFKEADEKSSWVRVPVINYLRACPLPEAKDYIKELEKVDPAAVKRANTFFPFGPGAGGAAGGKTSRVEQPAEQETLIASSYVEGASQEPAETLSPAASRATARASASPQQQPSTGRLPAWPLSLAASLLFVGLVVCGVRVASCSA